MRCFTIILGFVAGVSLGAILPVAFVSAIDCDYVANTHVSQITCCACNPYKDYSVDKIKNNHPSMTIDFCIIVEDAFNVVENDIDYYPLQCESQAHDVEIEKTVSTRRYTNCSQSTHFETDATDGGGGDCEVEHNHQFPDECPKDCM